MKIKQIAGILALLAVLVIGGCGVLPLVHYEDSVIKTANEWGIVL